MGLVLGGLAGAARAAPVCAGRAAGALVALGPAGRRDLLTWLLAWTGPPGRPHPASGAARAALAALPQPLGGSRPQGNGRPCQAGAAVLVVAWRGATACASRLPSSALPCSAPRTRPGGWPCDPRRCRCSARSAWSRRSPWSCTGSALILGNFFGQVVRAPPWRAPPTGSGCAASAAALSVWPPISILSCGHFTRMLADLVERRVRTRA